MSSERMLLHWSPRSPYVRLVMIAAHERGLADRLDCVRTLVGSFHVNPDIFPDNPLGKIPTLVLPDGRVLYDSRVITAYLDSIGAAGHPLTPHRDPERLDAMRRQALGIGFIDMMVFWMVERWRPEETRVDRIWESSRTKFASAVDGLDREVPRMAASAFDIGHLAIGAALTYADFRLADQQWRDGRPALADWFADISRRPSFVATAFVDDL
jgi:glutathione S-transferase